MEISVSEKIIVKDKSAVVELVIAKVREKLPHIFKPAPELSPVYSSSCGKVTGLADPYDVESEIYFLVMSDDDDYNGACNELAARVDGMLEILGELGIPGMFLQRHGHDSQLQKQLGLAPLIFRKWLLACEHNCAEEVIRLRPHGDQVLNCLGAAAQSPALETFGRKRKPHSGTKGLVLQAIKVLSPSGSVAIDAVKAHVVQRMPRTVNKRGEDRRAEYAETAVRNLVGSGELFVHGDEQERISLHRVADV
jgi:hypothetical protein